MMRMITIYLQQGLSAAVLLAALALFGCVGMTPATTGKQVHDLEFRDGFVGMTPVTGGVLTTTHNQRFTDEAIRRDWEALDALRSRIAAARLRATLGYAIARAEGELNFAIEEYEENDRTGILEPLLNDARRLVITQESGSAGKVDLSLPVLPGVTAVRADLWQLTQQAKDDPATLDCAGEAIARLEVGLLELAHEQYEVDAGLNTSEHVGSYVMLVDGLADDLRERMNAAACRPSPPPPSEVSIAVPAAPVKIRGITLSASVLFAFDKCGEAEISPEGRAQLDRFGAELVKQPDAWRRLVITGHTDRLGRHKYNLRLSLCRADAVRNYLVKKFGLPAGRTEARGMAAAQPVVFCSGPFNDKLKACLQPNRRVEIDIK